MKKAMKKRQTEYTTAQRHPSPAERGCKRCGEPFTLELSACKRRTGFSRYRDKGARIFCENLGGTAEALCLRPLNRDEGVFCFTEYA